MARGGVERILDKHGQQQEAVRRLDAPRGAARHEGACSRLEPGRLAADRRVPTALEDIQHLVPGVVAPLLARAVEAQQALLELRAPHEWGDRPAGPPGLDAVAQRPR